MLYTDFEAPVKNDAETRAALTYASIGIVMIQFIGIVIHPRLKEYILDKHCIRDHTEEPEPEPVVDHHREVTHNIVVLPRDDEPLLNNEDTN